MSTLLIISHTEHYKTANNEIVGLGSTVEEINHLVNIFDKVYHVAMLHKGVPPLNTASYRGNNIEFIQIPQVGGKRWYHKFGIIWYAPKTLFVIRKALKNVDYFQFRAPTGIGVYVIPFLKYFSKKKGWFKYAGNWQQTAIPKAYKFQRDLLINQNRKVTINGEWTDQPKHCYTFENPCLTDKEIEQGNIIASQKLSMTIDGITICFVGRLEEQKGVDRLLNAVISLPEKYQKKIVEIHIVGDGTEKQAYQDVVRDSNITINFHGWCSREKVHNIYKQSQLLILPSASEGFPKVIAEALNYGCIPIITKMDALLPYLTNNKNSFFLLDRSAEEINEKILKFINLSKSEYNEMIASGRKKSSLFSYSYYNKRIQEIILTD